MVNTHLNPLLNDPAQRSGFNGFGPFSPPNPKPQLLQISLSLTAKLGVPLHSYNLTIKPDHPIGARQSRYLDVKRFHIDT